MTKHTLWRMIAIAIVVLVFSQALNAVLGIASFEKIFRESLISYYRIIGNDIVRKIETAVKLGKPLEKFYGIDFILKPNMQKESLPAAVMVSDTVGTVLHGTDKKSIGKSIGLSPLPRFEGTSDASSDRSGKAHPRYVATLSGNMYHVTLPIYHLDKQWVGSVHVLFPKDAIFDRLRPMVFQSLRYLAVVSSVALAILVAVVFMIHRLDSRKHDERRLVIAPKMKIYLSIAFTLAISLAAYAYLSTGYFKRVCSTMVHQRISILSRLVKEDVDRILKMGVPIDHLKNMGALLDDIVRHVPECREIKILDNNRIEQYLADGQTVEGVFDENFKPQKFLHVDNAVTSRLEGRQGLEGFAVFIINSDLVDRQANTLTLDSLTIILVSLLFAFEMLFFSYVYTIETRKLKKVRLSPQAVADSQVDYPEARTQRVKFTILRATAFIFFFCEYVPLAFLPLFIKHLHEQNPLPLFGLSTQTILSLPISAYMLGVTIFVLVAGYLSERLSLLRSFVIFGILLFTGSVLSAFSQNVIQLIFFRFVSGAGYGGVLASGITMIIQNTDPSDRTTGFGAWLNGSATAIICAVPIGSVLSFYLGYKVALLFSAAAAAAFVFFVLYTAFRLHFLWMFEKPVSEQFAARPALLPNPSNKKELFFCVFKDQDVLAALIFASIPVQIAIIGFLHFGFPLFLDSVGISQSNIGRYITLYGLANIICTPLVSRWSDRLENERIFIILGNLLIGVVLISFTLVNEPAMLLVVIAVVGVGSAFVTSTTSAYVTLSRQAARIGASRLSSQFKTFQKLGTVAGPIMIGVLIGIYGYISAMAIIGATILIALMLFILFSRRLRGT